MFVAGVFSLFIVGAYGAHYGNDTCGVGDCHGCWVPATGPNNIRRSGDGKSGYSIKARDQPWMALIHYKDGSDRVCAGTLITDRHVLTARICVDKAGPNGHSDTLISPDSIEVTLACENGDGRCEYKVERIRTYQRQEGKYPEVAIIEFTKPVYEFDMTRKPVCIAESWMEVEAGKVNTVVWGVKSTAGVVTTRTLYAVNPSIVDFSQCEDWLGEHLPKTNLSHDMFCIERESLMLNGQGVYAGAPVVKQDAANARYEQTGIVIRADEYHNVAAVTKGNARVGGKATDGESTKPAEHPWLALIYYSGSDRKCAASLISDRHVLTARLCVDAEGPAKRSDRVVSVDSVRVRLTLGGYEGEREVIKIATWLDDKYNDDQYADLAVLEFKPAIYEWGETVRPICVANEYSFSPRGHSFRVVHWGELGPKTREMYTFAPTLENYQQCKERIVNGLSHNKLHTKDESICLVREAKMLQSGVYQGAPVLTFGDATSPHRDRLQQVGIITHIDDGNNVALATSLPHYADAVQKMTECYVQAKGFDSYLAPDRHCREG